MIKIYNQELLKSNEMELDGEVTEILKDRPNIKKFIFKDDEGFETICTAFKKLVSIDNIEVGKRCFIRGYINVYTWETKNKANIFENRFTVTSIK